LTRTIALLPAGSVSDEAAKLFFNNDSIEWKHHRMISDVFISTVEEISHYSVIPIENTIDGSVSLHLDWLLHQVDLPIQAEWVYPSIQNLIGRKSELLGEHEELDYSKIKKVITHPVAMAQCLEFIKAHFPHAEKEHVSSTAESVRIVRERPNEGIVAIGTSIAAENNELDILAREITDHNNNYTRFFLVGHTPYDSRKATNFKTSIVVTLPEDFPGALHQVLSAFAWRRLNLTRIDSRPTKKQLGSYYFYIEINESLENILVQASLQEIEAIGCQVRMLGSYPSFTYQQLQ